MRPLILAGATLLVLVPGFVLPAAAQQPLRKPGALRRFDLPPGLGLGQRPNDVRRAREVLQFYLKEGLRKPFIAEQTTRILSDMVRESQLVVKHQGPGKERMEFLSPLALKGEIILQVGGRIFNYKPSQNRIFEGVAPIEVAQLRSKEFVQDMRAGRIGVRVTGTEIVAGHNATIVEIRGGNGGKRLWIDDKTGVRLRTDELNAQGTVIQTSYFTKVEYEPVFEAADFLPRSLPAVPHEAQFPTKPPLPSVQEAQQQVAYPIREPSLPDGCRLTGVWVIAPAPGREVTILRYTDGVTTFALFQQLAPRALLNGANRGPAAPVRRTNGVIHWVGGDRQFTLLGNVRTEAARQIVESLR